MGDLICGVGFLGSVGVVLLVAGLMGSKTGNPPSAVHDPRGHKEWYQQVDGGNNSVRLGLLFIGAAVVILMIGLSGRR